MQFIFKNSVFFPIYILASRGNYHMTQVREIKLKAFLGLSNKHTWLGLGNNCGHNYLKKTQC